MYFIMQNSRNLKEAFDFLLKLASGHWNSKGFRRNMFLMTRATQKERATTSLKI